MAITYSNSVLAWQVDATTIHGDMQTRKGGQGMCFFRPDGTVFALKSSGIYRYMMCRSERPVMALAFMSGSP